MIFPPVRERTALTYYGLRQKKTIFFFTVEDEFGSKVNRVGWLIRDKKITTSFRSYGPQGYS